MLDTLHYRILIMSIFLIIYLCLGLPAVAWALYSLYRHRRSGGRVSAFVVSLLLSDLLELALSPVEVVISLREELCWGDAIHCHSVYALFLGARFCGLLFHQLVALECVLSLTHPLCSARLASSPWSPMLSLAAWLSVAFCQIALWLFGFFSLLFLIGFIINLFLCLVPVGILAVTCVLLLGAPPSPDHAPYTARPGLSVLVLAAFTLVVLYGPFLLVICMWIYRKYGGVPNWVPESVWLMTLSVMSLRVIADPLLCVLVWRETPRGRNRRPT